MATITKIPSKAHPLVQLLYAEMIRQGIGLLELSKLSGIPRSTINQWKHRGLNVGPNVTHIEKCFNALGIELWPVRVEHRPAAKPIQDPIRVFQQVREAA